MKSFLNVFRFELLNQLRKKSVIVSSIVMALAVLILTLMPLILDAFKGAPQAATEAPQGLPVAGVGLVILDPEVKEALLPKLNEPHTYEDRDALVKAVQSNQMRVGVVISDFDHMETIYQDKGSNARSTEPVLETLNALSKERALAKLGVSASEFEKLSTHEVVATETVMGRDSNQSMLLTQVLMILLYMMIIMYGAGTATVIAREKDTRTMELLITSTRPAPLILGKVAASGVAALLQMLMLVVAGVIGFSIAKSHYPPFLLFALSASLSVKYVLSYLFFSLLGFVMYLCLFAAFGSVASKMEDVQSSIGVIQFVFIAAYIASSVAMNMPDSGMSVFTSIFPLTSLMVMPVRVGLTTVPIVELIASMALLVAACAFFAFLSIRIYRFGTLNYGNKKGFFFALKQVLKKQ